jgi:FkbM family methyltransferase
MPRLVVDLGAHCGHFSMLADVCFQTQFAGAQGEPTEYLLVEPNPELLGVIRRNLKRSRLCLRHSLHQGLVGALRAGSATLWISPKNYLSAGLRQGTGTRGIQVDYIDLEGLLAGKPIDLLKVDIEGAEFEFVQHYPRVLTQVNALMMEIHDVPGESREDLLVRLSQFGLRLRGQPLQHGGATLAMFQRW